MNHIGGHGNGFAKMTVGDEMRGKRGNLTQSAAVNNPAAELPRNAALFAGKLRFSPGIPVSDKVLCCAVSPLCHQAANLNAAFRYFL
jgi:hypothetical protein